MDSTFPFSSEFWVPWGLIKAGAQVWICATPGARELQLRGFPGTRPLLWPWGSSPPRVLVKWGACVRALGRAGGAVLGTMEWLCQLEPPGQAGFSFSRAFKSQMVCEGHSCIQHLLPLPQPAGGMGVAVRPRKALGWPTRTPPAARWFSWRSWKHCLALSAPAVPIMTRSVEAGVPPPRELSATTGTHRSHPVVSRVPFLY